MTNDGFSNLRPVKVTHWTLYIDDDYFEFYGCPLQKLTTMSIIESYGKCGCFQKKKSKKKTETFLPNVSLFLPNQSLKNGSKFSCFT